MIKYKAGRRRRVNPVRMIIAIAVVVAIVLLVVFLINTDFGKATNEKPSEDAIIDETATFDKGVKVADFNLEGLTLDQAEQNLIPIANQMLTSKSVTINVEGEDKTYKLDALGVEVNTKEVLEEAIMFKQDKKLFADEEEIPVKNFDLAFVLDETTLANIINTDAKEWNKEAKNASFKVATEKSEENKTTGGSLEVTPGEEGYTVNTEEIIANIKQQVETGSFAPFKASVTVTEPSVKQADLDKLEVIGDYTTEFNYSKTASEPNRVYNIWKISDSLNGAIIDPGDSFSVNDHVGPRTEELGWKLANGIENGDYTPQAGGGICQVSTTLYNAGLLAELKMVKRIPHSIPSAYVPLGLDATISTGGPDFEFKNNTDYPIAIIVKCNGPDKKIRVQIYGHKPRDYKLKFSSELVEEIEPPPTTFKVNSAMAPGTYELKLTGRKGKVAHVFQQKLDLDGKAIGEKEKVNQASYKPFAPIVEIASDIPIPPVGTTYEQFVATRQAAAPQVPEPAVPPTDPTPPPEQSVEPVPPQPPTPPEPHNPEQPVA